MVRALLDGRKTQFREPVKPKCYEYDGAYHWKGKLYGAVKDGVPFESMCPYGQPRDKLWVKETWAPMDSLGESYPIVQRYYKEIPDEAFNTTDDHII